MRTRLSSSWTTFYRVFSAPLWIAGFGAGTLALAAMSMKLRFLVMWLFGSVFIIWFVRRMSEVWIDGDALVVVRGRLEERIPLAAVDGMTETRFWNPKQIKVQIRRGMASQHTVVFIAPWGIQLPSTDHPVVRQLRAAVEHARSLHSFDARSSS